MVYYIAEESHGTRDIARWGFFFIFLSSFFLEFEKSHLFTYTESHVYKLIWERRKEFVTVAMHILWSSMKSGRAAVVHLKLPRRGIYIYKYIDEGEGKCREADNYGKKGWTHRRACFRFSF